MGVQVDTWVRQLTFTLYLHYLTVHRSTWRGEPGEEWSTVQCLESVLLSIQSLMAVNPYENEPGFENSRQSDARDHKEYSAKVGTFATVLYLASSLFRILGVRWGLLAMLTSYRSATRPSV